jgi:hypothetical protein
MEKLRMTITKFVGLVFIVCIGVNSASCQNNESDLPALEEQFHTDRDEGDNVDSPAVWHGPDGQHWLLATAKEGDTIIAFDATDGSLIKRFGKSGSGSGQFERPNGIAVIDDLVLVVERDRVVFGVTVVGSELDGLEFILPTWVVSHECSEDASSGLMAEYDEDVIEVKTRLWLTWVLGHGSLTHVTG